MPRGGHKIPAFVVADPTRAAQREALWRTTPSERVAAMYRGHLTLSQCLAARHPDQVPQLNGESWFMAIRIPEVAEPNGPRPTTENRPP